MDLEGPASGTRARSTERTEGATNRGRQGGSREPGRVGTDRIERVYVQDVTQARTVLVQVDRREGGPVLSFQWSYDIVKALFQMVTDELPAELHLLDERTFLATFRMDNVAAACIARLEGVREWFGTAVRVQATLPPPDTIQDLVKGAMAPDPRHAPAGATPVQQFREEILQRIAELQAQVSASSLAPPTAGTAPAPPSTPGTPQAMRATARQRGGNVAGRGGKPPKLPMFRSNTDLQKDEVHYSYWKFAVNTIRPQYEESMVMEAIVQSLRGMAAHLIMFMGTRKTVADVLEKLDTVYGNVQSFDTMMQTLYKFSQLHNEEVAHFATRLEGGLAEIRGEFPEKFANEAEADTILKDRLFAGMERGLKNSLRFQYEKDEVGYHELLRNARKAEAEYKASKMGQQSVRVGSKAAQAKPQPLSLATGETDSEGDGSDEGPQGEIESLSRELARTMALQGWNRDQRQPQGGSYPPRPRVDRATATCRQCKGIGHFKRECPSNPAVQALNERTAGTQGVPLPAAAAPQADQVAQKAA